MNDQITFQLTGIDAAEAERVLAEVDGADAEESFENLGVLEGLVIIAAAIAGAKVIIRLWREFRGGTIIDMTKKPPDVSRDRDLDHGFFMIIAADGTVTVEAKDEPEDSLERMVSAILKLAADSTVGVIKAALEGKVPDDKVKVEPAAG